MGNTCPTCRRDVPARLALCPHDGTPLGTVVEDRLLGVALAGRYLLRECVGLRGSFRIYAAEEQQSQRSVLVTLAERAVDAAALARFRELAEGLSGLEHASLRRGCSTWWSWGSCGTS